jgi:N4-gp56 family major capsid protein
MKKLFTVLMLILSAIVGAFNKPFALLPVNLKLFDNTNTTGQTGANQDLSAEMKTYYSDYMIDNAVPKLVHDQFGQKQPIPKNGGKIIEFRKYSPLAKALTPLTEGVTPSGKKLNVSVITATIAQYGDYIELSDMLLLTAIDNNMVQATKLLGNQAGATLDTITREVLNGGTNVQYANAQVAARYLLVGGDATPANNHYASVAAIKRSTRTLKVQNADKIDNYFVAIIHPDAAYDIMNDSEWIEASKYAGSTQLFEGEIGKIGGVRFVESTEAKVFHAANLTAAARNLGITSLDTKTFTMDEAITEGEAAALVGRKVIVKGYQYTVTAAVAGAAGTITVAETVQGSPGSSDIMYPGEAGAAGRDVYSTLVLGENAYGTTEITGGGLEHIVKQLGSAGTADALNQRATVGWKATKVAERLVEGFMVRVETASTFEIGAN